MSRVGVGVESEAHRSETAGVESESAENHETPHH